MNLIKYLLAMTLLVMISACGSNKSETGSNVISLKGGAGGTAQGGNGGTITSFSNVTSAMVHGDLKFRGTGTVDTTFTVPGITPDFGSNPATITSNTTADFRLGTDPLPAAGTYFVTDVDSNLHRVNQAGTGESIVTGITVNAGATLFISNSNGHTDFPGGVVINGKVTNTAAQDGGALDLRSASFLQINAGGKVTTTPTGTGTSSGLLSLTSTNGVLINYGTIESIGRTSSGGASNGVTLTAGTLLYNVGPSGTVSAKGDGIGTGGPIQLLANAGSVFSSGTIDSSGGSSATGGGTAGSITISGGTSATVVGRVMLGGTVTGNGGDSTGASGNGGNGAAISLTSYSGGILVNATISANGGKGGTGGNGGNGGSLQMHNKTGTDNAAKHQVSPEGIKVGSLFININGGQGGAQGGTGGTIAVASDIEDTSLNGFGNVEFFGYQSFTLDGGTSDSGSGGKGGDVTCGLTGSFVLGVQFPSGAIINEVLISGKGGDSKNKTAAGGDGGSVTFKNPQKFDFGDPVRTVVSNTNIIDISGGAGLTGGNGGKITMTSYGNLTSSGNLTGTGGTSTTGGAGTGGTVELSSSFNVSNSGLTSVDGGSGQTQGGEGGSVTIKSGNQTSTNVISASGGSGGTGTGGKGGTVVLSSAFASTSRTTIGVARGSGGANTSASPANGTVNIDGSFAATALPLSGII